ncbi:hypothetical protein KCU88_g2808, partial [Aureobasidium melanogenum]
MADTTLDSNLIGRMLHVNCNQHHCGDKHSQPRPQPQSISNPINGNVPAPEYLHCGFWPRPLTPADVDEESHDPRGLHDHHNLGMGRSRPTTSTTFLRPDVPVPVPNNTAAGSLEPQSSEVNDDDFDDSDDEDDHEIIHKPVDEHHSVVTDQFSKAVDSWRSLLREEREGDSGPPAATTTKKPYSIMRLFARQTANDSKNEESKGSESGGATTESARQSLFDQEIAAECRARSEIMEYIDALVDKGDYEDAYACIWPLEEYRRNGWAEEMIFAFPKECWEFVDMVRAREQQAK